MNELKHIRILRGNMEYASFLRRHIEDIIILSDDEFTTVLNYFVPLSVPKRALLIGAGQKVTAEYWVVNGCLKTSVFEESGKEHIMQFALENWWVSDYPAYTQHSQAQLTVQALENSFVLELSAKHREEMCQLVPKMYIFMGKKALSGYVASQKRILSLLRNSAKEKYELLLHLYPQLFQRLPKKTIAHYLGVSRETLSRLEKKK